MGDPEQSALLIYPTVQSTVSAKKIRNDFSGYGSYKKFRIRPDPDPAGFETLFYASVKTS